MKLILTVAFLAILSVSPALAQDLSEFKRILIADHGRIKPLDSFSKTLSLKISGQSKNHNQWLFESLFEPERANTKDFFLIENPELQEALGLVKTKKRFSFNELDSASQKLFELSKQIADKDEKEYTMFDKQLINLRTNFYSFINITNSLLFSIENKAFTVSNELQSELSLGSTTNSLYDILQASEKLSDQVAKIDTSKSNISNYQKDLLELSLTLYAWVENFKNFDDTFISETKLSIIPNTQEDNQWLSPWQVIFQPSKETNTYLWLLSEAQKNYKDSSNLNQKLKEFNQKVLKEIKHKAVFVEAEILYNTLNPFKYALIFYLLAIVSLVLSLKNKKKTCLIQLSYWLWVKQSWSNT